MVKGKVSKDVKKLSSRKLERYKSKLEINIIESEIHEIFEILMLYKDFLIKRSDIDDFLIERGYSEEVCNLIQTIRKKIRPDNIINTLCSY